MALKQEKFFDVEYDFDVRLWRADGRELFERDEATQWEIGDWLLECDAHGKFTQREKTFACRIAKRNWNTLKNYKSLSNQFPKEPKGGSPSLRSDALTYSAYRLVGPFSQEDREKLLAFALACKKKDGHAVTVDQLTHHIRMEQKIGRLPVPNEAKSKANPKPQMVKIGFYCTQDDFDELLRLAQAFGKGSVARFVKWLADQYWEEHKEKLWAQVDEYEGRIAELARKKAVVAVEADRRLDEAFEESR